VTAKDEPSALLFPGQGSQNEEMRELVAEMRPDLLRLVTEELGTDPFPRVNQGTLYAQPALFCASVAGWELLGRPRSEVIAGHSLGELAALVAAGSLGAEDGVRLAVSRGRLMSQAAALDPGGGMIALLGDEEESRRIAASCGLCVANHNAPGQLVLSGPGWKLDAARSLAREARLKSARLQVEGAFHSPAMQCIVSDYGTVLDEVPFQAPAVCVFSSTAARPFDDIRARLADALIMPVRWHETLDALYRDGVRVFREVGPGKVLTNLVRRSLVGVEATSLEEMAVGHA
jgi:[acyl-carrier-protein] S-malonyltransferase